MEKVLKGINPAILTPFRDEGIDEGAFLRLIDFLIKAGVDGLFVGGTTGEGPLLSIEERKRLIELAVKGAGGRVKVAFQAGCPSTKDTISLLLHAREVGADAAAVLAPYYYRYDDEALLTHFVKVAGAVPDLPIYLYNIPMFTGNDIRPRLAKEIAGRCPNIVGLKDTTRDFDRFLEYLSELSPKLSILMGNDSYLLSALLMGGTGAVSAVGNVFPEMLVRIYHLFKEGRVEEAVREQLRVIRVKEILREGGLAAHKAALALRGIPSGGVRPPQMELTEGQRLNLERRLKEEGFL